MRNTDDLCGAMESIQISPLAGGLWLAGRKLHGAVSFRLGSFAFYLLQLPHTAIVFLGSNREFNRYWIMPTVLYLDAMGILAMPPMSIPFSRMGSEIVWT